MLVYQQGKLTRQVIEDKRDSSQTILFGKEVRLRSRLLESVIGLTSFGGSAYIRMHFKITTYEVPFLKGVHNFVVLASMCALC